MNLGGRNYYCNKCTGEFTFLKEGDQVFNIRGYTFCEPCYLNQKSAFPDKITESTCSVWTYKDQLRKEWSDQCKCDNCCDDHYGEEGCKYCRGDYPPELK
jgi:hypothetical protein